MRDARLGLDIGSTNLHMALVGGGGLILAATEALPEDRESVPEFIRECLRRHGVKTKSCGLLFPPGDVLRRRFRAPRMSRREAAFYVPFEFRDFTGGGEGYIYDYAVLAEDGDGMEVLGAAARLTTLEGYSKLLRRAGLRLASAVPAEMAYTGLLRAARDVGHGHCILDLGANGARMYFFAGPRFERGRVLEGPPDPQTLAAELRRAVNFCRTQGMDIRHIHRCGGGWTGELSAEISEALGIEVLGVEELFPGVPGELMEGASLAAGAAGAALY